MGLKSRTREKASESCEEMGVMRRVECRSLVLGGEKVPGAKDVKKL